jgi:phosphoribosylamine-glycine ligase
MKTITANSTLKEVLEIKGANDILTKHNVPCIGCALAQMEMDKLTLKDICEKYNIDINRLLEDLNKSN